MTGPIAVTEHGDWAEIRIDREGKRNAMNREARSGLMAAFDQLRGRAKAIVLTGTGIAFCAGIDLKERAADRERGVDSAGEEWIEVILAVRSHPAVFIAAVNGFALGGGATLVNVCDLAVASTTASIGCPEMGFATYPGMAGPAIQLSGITRKQAASLILTTNRIDGATAQRWGMVNECVQPDDLLPRARELAEHVAGFDAVALGEAKRALDHIPGIVTTWPEAMDHGQRVNKVIRSKTTAQRDGEARFAAGGKNRGQGARHA